MLYDKMKAEKDTIGDRDIVALLCKEQVLFK